MNACLFGWGALRSCGVDTALRPGNSRALSQPPVARGRPVLEGGRERCRCGRPSGGGVGQWAQGHLWCGSWGTGRVLSALWWSLHSPGSRAEAGGTGLGWVLKSRRPPRPPPLLPRPSFSHPSPSGGPPRVPVEQEALGQDSMPFSEPTSTCHHQALSCKGHTSSNIRESWG